MSSYVGFRPSSQDMGDSEAWTGIGHEGSINIGEDQGFSLKSRETSAYS